MLANTYNLRLTSEEIIDYYSEDVALIIDKLRHKKDRLDLMRWLNNFNEQDKTSALDILQRLVFVDDDQLHIEAEDLIIQLKAAVPPKSVFYFYPIAKYGKSATLVSYFFEHAPSFVELAKNGRAYFLSNENDVNTTVIYENTVLVFFDDFFGTGGSFIKSYENLAALTSSKFRTNKFQFAIAIYRMALAEKKIGDSYPVMRFFGNIHAKLFDPANKMFSPKNEIDRQKALAGGYATRHKLFINYEGTHSLGYKESEALISFAYRPPNNTLPIIWAKKEQWYPFLPRFGSEIYNSVKDYKAKLLLAAAKLEFGLPRTVRGLKKIDNKQLNLLLVLSMLERKTSEPLIAVIIGISGKDLKSILDLAITSNYLSLRLEIKPKGFTALKELQNLVNEMRRTEKIKMNVKDHNIEYMSKTVSGK